VWLRSVRMRQPHVQRKLGATMLWLVALLSVVSGCGDEAEAEPAPSCPVSIASAPEGTAALTYSGIASGQKGTCVVASNGGVHCWEYGDQGEAREVADVTNVRRVVVGPQRSCAIRDGGSVVCWSDSGPREEVPGLCGATELAAGESLTCAVASSGQVLCQGQLYLPGLVEGYSDDFVEIPDLQGATAIAVGRDDYACALVDDGSITCWGGGPRPADRPGIQPAPIPEISEAIAIAGSGGDICAVLADGTVSCWSPSRAPAPVAGLSQVASLSVGPRHGCASLTDGTVRCWGANSSGELGDGTWVDSDVAVQVAQLEGVREVSVGARTSVDMGFSCALQASGIVACWGAKTQSTQNGDWVASPTPVTVRLP
jgi:alpha-tubulin suppressor-like RCC1 family protein